MKKFNTTLLDASTRLIGMMLSEKQPITNVGTRFKIESIKASTICKDMIEVCGTTTCRRHTSASRLFTESEFAELLNSGTFTKYFKAGIFAGKPEFVYTIRK